MVALPRTTDVRVAVVGEDPLARAGIVGLLASQPGIAVTPDLLAGGADVLAWDLGTDAVGGLERLRALHDTNVPALAMAPTTSPAADVLAAGARGVVDRGADGSRLAAALRATAEGFMVVDEAFTLPSVPHRAAAGEGLTPREREVLSLVAEGHPNKIIADRLGISEHTAKFHINTIFAKLGATSRTEAVVRAVRQGLLTL